MLDNYSSGAEQIEEGAVLVNISAVIVEEIYGNNSASALARASGQLATKSGELAMVQVISIRIK